MTVLPAHPAAPDLIAGKQALDEAAAGADKAEQAATAADRVRVARQATVDGLASQAEALAAELTGQPGLDEIAAGLARIDAAKAAAAEARQREGVSRQAESTARQTVEAAAAAMKETEAAVTELRTAFDRARDSVAAHGPPPPGRVDLAADWAVLSAWAAEAAVRQRAAERDATAEMTRLARATADLVAAAVAAFREAGLGDPPPVPGRVGLDTAGGAERGSAVLEALGVTCARAEADAAAKLERIREMMAEAQRLAKQAAEADREATVARSLARHLSAKGFERWMLAEVLDGLVAGASVILHDLSSGAYSLATDDDGEFSVIDHRNADERRSAKTLSGGETFQASLALALALAAQLSSLAAAGAARIETTFIDEGFGTLDEDTLETVASTIEALGGGDRLVGVVTHVAALAERVPVRLEVTKGPRTATVTKVVA